jgi:arsenate reductase
MSRGEVLLRYLLVAAHRGEAVTGCKTLPRLFLIIVAVMITIYHNPRCSKSRAACSLLETVYQANGEPIQVVEYLKQPPSVEQLADLHRMLGGPVRNMVRVDEAEYRELDLGRADVTDADIYDAITKHPILLQRPIVVRDGRAVLGRPPENVAALFA